MHHQGITYGIQSAAHKFPFRMKTGAEIRNARTGGPSEKVSANTRFLVRSTRVHRLRTFGEARGYPRISVSMFHALLDQTGRRSREDAPDELRLTVAARYCR